MKHFSILLSSTFGWSLAPAWAAEAGFMQPGWWARPTASPQRH